MIDFTFFETVPITIQITIMFLFVILLKGYKL